MPREAHCPVGGSIKLAPLRYRTALSAKRNTTSCATSCDSTNWSWPTTSAAVWRGPALNQNGRISQVLTHTFDTHRDGKLVSLRTLVDSKLLTS